jgi:hypothetical protein
MAFPVAVLPPAGYVLGSWGSVVAASSGELNGDRRGSQATGDGSIVGGAQWPVKEVQEKETSGYLGWKV